MTRDELPIKVWLWRAWAKDRSRICDCGTVRATDQIDVTGDAAARLEQLAAEFALESALH